MHRGLVSVLRLTVNPLEIMVIDSRHTGSHSLASLTMPGLVNTALVVTIAFFLLCIVVKNMLLNVS